MVLLMESRIGGTAVVTRVAGVASIGLQRCKFAHTVADSGWLRIQDKVIVCRFNRVYVNVGARRGNGRGGPRGQLFEIERGGEGGRGPFAGGGAIDDQEHCASCPGEGVE